MDPVVGIGIRRRIQEILQPAEMIEISDIEQVVAIYVEIEDRFPLLIGETSPYPSIEQVITRRNRFSIIGQESPVLRRIIFELRLYESMDDPRPLHLEFVTQLGNAMGRRNIRQVFGAIVDGLARYALIIPVDHRQAVLEMQPFYRVNIEAGFAAIELRARSHKLEDLVGPYRRIAAIHGRDALVVNIITDRIIEQGKLGHYGSGRIGEPDILLQAELRLEIGIAHLVDIGARVYPVGRDLRDIRGPESTGEIGF